MNDEATYVCDSCGDENVVPLDLTAGASQEYIEVRRIPAGGTKE